MPEERSSSYTRSELVLFLLDGSGSMRSRVRSDNGSSKADALHEIMQKTLERLSRSRVAGLLKISIVRFGTTAVAEQSEDGSSYYGIAEAQRLLRLSTENFAETEGTDMVTAIDKANEIVKRYESDSDLPRRKSYTLILFTDGKHAEHLKDDEVIHATEKVRIEEIIEEVKQGWTMAPAFACVSLGEDADMEFLIRISSLPSVLQETRLMELDFSHPDMIQKGSDFKLKLCIVGHKDNSIGEDEADFIRAFLDIASNLNIAGDAS